MDLKLLKKPFPPKSISWRLGSTTADRTRGMALAYIDPRDVMERLDEVCGPENWQVEYPFPGCCRIGIKYGQDWVWKANGAGEAVVREEAKEEERIMKEKGNYSDAFKRAAVLWGVGRYLYELPSPWVAIQQKGKSYVIADSEKASLIQRLTEWQAKKFGG